MEAAKPSRFSAALSRERRRHAALRCGARGHEGVSRGHGGGTPPLHGAPDNEGLFRANRDRSDGVYPALSWACAWAGVAGGKPPQSAWNRLTTACRRASRTTTS